MRKTVLALGFSLGLFFIVVGAKWATFARFGSPMPDWDQWDAEAMELFAPWFEHDHFLAHLFHPHNEHRVILTKLQNLALGLANGQWDSRVEAAANAMLHGLLALGFWWLGRRWIEARWQPLLFGLILLLFAPPLAWQNVLGGFHSQQYWLLGLSFAAIVVLPFVRAWTFAWWLGLFAAILALGSMGSGFLAAAVILLVLGWRLLRRESAARDVWPTLLFGIVLVAVGLATRVEVPWHQKLKATTVHDFAFSIIHSLEWPWREAHWAAFILWLPWLLAAWLLLPWRRNSSPAPTSLDYRRAETLLALGGWVLVQIVATAYARGVGADYPASRYMDTLAFGATVNGLGLLWWLQRQPLGRKRLAGYGIALAWLLTLGFGLRGLLNDVIRYELPDAKKYYITAEGRMQRFLATNDPRQLAYKDIPFPSAEGLIERLRKPSVRALMPLPIRAPLRLTPAGTGGGFDLNDARNADVEFPPRAGLSPTTPPLDAAKTWGSYGGAGPAEWQSEPLKPTGAAWLKFETAGDIGRPGISLELRDAASQEPLAEIRPTKPPHDSWRAAYVRMPRRPFVVVARDESATGWLAFSGPTEMGRLSWWAWQLTKNGLLILSVAAGTTLLLGIFAWRTSPRPA
jgi:hypothetical protein